MREWKPIDEQPPLDRPFLGCRVGRKNPDTGKPIPDMYFLIRGLHAGYEGGPRNWTWNDASGNYGIYLTHWQELPMLPAPPEERE